jgi:dipeptidyl aminopeptidase/acylaminoacyl peptidase
MRIFAALLVCAIPALADGPSLERLFTRPTLWGTPPEQPTWAKKANTLVFLWNGQGRRFHDLYAYNAGSGKLVRLTDLESQKDELNTSEEEKDERLKQYTLPAPGVAGFDVSQDGTQVAFSYKGDLFLVKTDGATPLFRLTHTKTPEAGPQFSPDGKLLASVRGGQIVVQDLGNGQLWQVTDIEAGGSLGGYRWSPDGRKFAYSVRHGAGRTLPIANYSGRFVATRNIPRSVAGDEDMANITYFIAPLDGSKPTALESAPGVARGFGGLPEWSPDSKRLLHISIAPNWKKKQIIVLDSVTGKPKSVAEESDDRWVDYGFAGWAPDSKSIFFTNEKDGWAHLYRVGIEGGAPQQLTRGPWEIHREPFTENPQWIGDWIYYTSTEGDTAQRHSWRIKSDGSGKEKLSQHEGINSGVVSDDGKYTAWMRADMSNPLDLWVNDKRVTKSPLPAFYETKWPETRFVSYPARGDKRMVAARLMLPPDLKFGDRNQKPRPAIVYIHGAGYATSVLKQWGSYQDFRFAYNTFLANKGYVILEMDYRGSTGYGRDWRSGVYLHMGGPDLDDVLGGVDYLKSLGSVDVNRVGIWGVSYGGFMTDMALFMSPGTFKAGAAWAAVNDWENYNAGYTAQRLNTPQQNPEAYRRSSPIHFSNNLKDHLLIVHGIVDDNVLFQDAVQLTEKLIHEGKDFSHIFYPEESHGFIRDETWIDAFRRTTEWFDRYLK